MHVAIVMSTIADAALSDISSAWYRSFRITTSHDQPNAPQHVSLARNEANFLCS